MFGKSYSKESFILLKAKLIEINNSWIFPEYIPSVHDVIPQGFGGLFGKKNRERKALARKRQSFVSGVMHAATKHHFDGKDKHFKKFQQLAIRESFGSKIGNWILKGIEESTKEPEMFVRGVEWGYEQLSM